MLTVFTVITRLGRRAALLFFFLAVAFWPWSSTASAETVADEYQIKAVFLYNLTNFVSWPEENTSSDEWFVLGIYGSDPFGSVIDKAVAGERSGGKPITVFRYKTLQELWDVRCDMLYIASDALDDFAGINEIVSEYPILTVADTPGFPEQGGMVNLLKAQKKIVIEINRQKALDAGLAVSSKLLRLARVIE